MRSVLRVETFRPLVGGFDSTIYGMAVIVGFKARILRGFVLLYRNLIYSSVVLAMG